MKDLGDKILVGFLIISAGLMSLSLFLILSTATPAMLWRSIVLGSLVFSGAIGILVYRDAVKHADLYPGAWALGTWLLLIIVLPVYLYHRAYGSKR